MPATIIIGSQWGDEGKGLISAYVSARDSAKLVCKAGTGCNAEHGIYLKDEKTYLKVNQLPLGWIMSTYPNIRIGSGVALSPEKFFDEVNRYGLHERVKVDFRCPIVTQEHIDAEKNSKGMNAIGSTFSGTGYCQADFVLRKAKQARDIPALEPYLTNLGNEINNVAKNNRVVIESSQGTFLSLAISEDYPNTTSGNVTTCAVADDVLLNWKHIDTVVLVVKALPTREGKGRMGFSNELSEKEIEEKGLKEISSIGGVTRRKADRIDFDLLKEAVELNGATEIALTFCEHFDNELRYDPYKITHNLYMLIKRIERETNIPVTILNTGKAYNSIIDLTPDSFVNWDFVDRSVNLAKTTADKVSNGQ